MIDSKEATSKIETDWTLETEDTLVELGDKLTTKTSIGNYSFEEAWERLIRTRDNSW